MGDVCHVNKAKRVAHIYDLTTLQQERLNKQDMGNCCGVEVHANSCQYSTFPSL